MTFLLVSEREVDRLLDMIPTAVNVTGDATVATIVAHKEGQLDLSIYNDPDVDHEGDEADAQGVTAS